MNITFTDKSVRSNTIGTVKSCSIVSLYFALVSFTAVGYSLWMMLTTDELGKPVAIGGVGLLLLLCSYLINNLAKAVSAKVAKDDEDAKDADYMDKMNRIEDRAREENDEISDRFDGLEESVDRRFNDLRRDLTEHIDRNYESVWRKFDDVEVRLPERKR